MTIATDNVDESFVRKPRDWDIRLVRDFMLVMGSVSSLYDIVTFVALFLIFNASPPLFRTGWFVESFAMQTLVVFVIRTAGNPFRSRPSSALAIAMVAATVVGLALPFTPIAGALGFVPLPGSFYIFVGAVVVAYLALADLIKRRLLARPSYGWSVDAPRS